METRFGRNRSEEELGQSTDLENRARGGEEIEQVTDSKVPHAIRGGWAGEEAGEAHAHVYRSSRKENREGTAVRLEEHVLCSLLQTDNLRPWAE